MFRCRECGFTFSEPERFGQRHPYGECGAVENWDGCPGCTSSGYDEIIEDKE